MATSKKDKNESKNLRTLFSVICLSIIALGLIVYFSPQGSGKAPVGEPTSVTETTSAAAVQHRVEGVTETAPATTAGTTAAATKGTTTTEPASMQQSDTNMPYKSFYKYPVSESVQQSYNEELTFNRTMGDYRAHAAVDFKANKGAKVSAINDGLVLSVKTDALLGKVITIDHGGNLVAQYCGMDAVNVSAGNYVTLGQDLGTLGTVPFEAEEAPHLHLITTMNKETVDPLKVMSKTKD